MKEYSQALGEAEQSCQLGLREGWEEPVSWKGPLREGYVEVQVTVRGEKGGFLFDKGSGGICI